MYLLHLHDADVVARGDCPTEQRSSRVARRSRGRRGVATGSRGLRWAVSGLRSPGSAPPPDCGSASRWRRSRLCSRHGSVFAGALPLTVSVRAGVNLNGQWGVGPQFFNMQSRVDRSVATVFQRDTRLDDSSRERLEHSWLRHSVARYPPAHTSRPREWRNLDSPLPAGRIHGLRFAHRKL
jgi:hypothetical protein